MRLTLKRAERWHRDLLKAEALLDKVHAEAHAVYLTQRGGDAQAALDLVRDIGESSAVQAAERIVAREQRKLDSKGSDNGR